MSTKIIEFKVLAVAPTPAPEKKSYVSRELITAVDIGEKKFYLTRYVKDNEYHVKIGQIYQGDLKPTTQEEKKKGYKDTIWNAKPLNGWNGIDLFPAENGWDMESDPAREQLERQASILCQSDMHTAAPIVAIYITKDTTEQHALDMLDHWTLTIKEFRESMTNQYVQEMEKKGE